MKVTFKLPGDDEILGYDVDRLLANISDHDRSIAEIRAEADKAVAAHEQHKIVLHNILARKEMLERGGNHSAG